MAKVEFISSPSDVDWLNVKNKALGTIGKETNKFPTDNWKAMILMSEHSPIRDLIYSWKWVDIKSWISVHFVRHYIGVNHFVETQRNDRQDEYDRDTAPQNALVTHNCTANAQSIIDISKVRLCNKAHIETIQMWILFLDQLKSIDLNLYKLSVPKCIYRNGFCTEPQCCGYNRSAPFKNKLQEYAEFIKNV
jgi:hypothetical protein